MGQQSSRKDRVFAYGIVSLILVLLALEIAGLILWMPGTWNDRLTAVLAIVGIYGLAIGFFSRSAALVDFRDTLEDLTSPNVLKYLGGNFYFLPFLFSLAAVGLSKYKIEGYPVALGCLGQFLYLALMPFLFAYAVFHIFVVAVLSYLPVVLASAMVAPIVYSSGDIEISIGQKKVLVSSIVKKDPVAIKGFLIGVPALLVSLLSAISAPFISG